jgi:hypothetical protein
MERWLASIQFALEHRVVQGVLACAFLVPLIATVGQYWSSGFWWQSSGVELLFWPGQKWHWVVRMPVWVSMGAMLASYLAGIAWLLRRRTLSVVALSAIGALIVANVAAGGLNYLTGWRELQVVAGMDLAGKANRAIFSLWHNPVWEEVIFHGIPLVLLLLVRRIYPAAARWSLWCYYLVPSLIFAAYHVPGHGPSRMIDTFLLSLVFAWMTLRFTFFAPLVMHYTFDAVMTMSLGKVPSIPANEVAWLARHFTLLNSTWTIALLVWMATIPVVVLVRRYRLTRTPAAAPVACS